MIRSVSAVAFAMCVAAGVVTARQSAPVSRTTAPRVSVPPASSPTALGETIDKYCSGCHNSRTKSAATTNGVILDRAMLADAASHPEIWEKVVRKLRLGAMPPDGMPHPDAAAHDALVSWLETSLDRAAVTSPNPGRPAIHRLNRAEYANAIRDLLAFDVDASTLLPPDDAAAGFDNNADILGVSPALLERYVSAAGRISALAVGSPKISASSSTYRVKGDASQTMHQEGLPLGTRGGVMGVHTFPLDGEYVIKVKLLETNLGSIRGLEQRHDLEITVDGERVLLAPVGGPEDYVESSKNATNVVNSLDKRLQVRVRVKAGQRPVTAAFLQTSATLGGTRLQPFERSTVIATDHIGLPHVENMVVSGPFNPTGSSDTPSRRRIFTCGIGQPQPQVRLKPDPRIDTRGHQPQAGKTDSRGVRLQPDQSACAKRILTGLVQLAYRHTPTAADLQPLMKFYEQGRAESFEAGIELALRAMLASPKFVLRIERDPAGVAPGGTYRVSDVDLASRLSFFLWSSIPDRQLLDLAARGRLHEPATLRAQVRRMLADPRAGALTQNFAGQWLQIRNIHSSTPDKNDFPDFDDNLRQAFEHELNLFFDSIVREDRNVLDLLTADYSFLNERLARHYGVPYVYGSQFRRVTGLDDNRRGLLGKGGILLVTSHADRTSPVVRGKWILDTLLGSPPPPPPPDVPALPDSKATAPTTLRARLELHRANAPCAGCHKLMDPLGLSLENFNAVGAWRTEDAGAKIDASARFLDGTPLDGVASLRAVLLARKDVFVGTMTEKLLTYALGRGLQPTDMPAVRAIVRQAARDNYRFSSLIEGVVGSVPFTQRRAEKSEGS
jgi:hypothetical protein